MISKTTFLEEEIPYQKLEKLGISRKSFLNMPKEVIEPLVCGRITPLVMARYEAKNNKVLVEGNRWGDTCWGVDTRTGRGENHLGKILMNVREELKLYYEKRDNSE